MSLLVSALAAQQAAYTKYTRELPNNEEVHEEYLHAKWQHDRSCAQAEENEAYEDAKHGWQKTKDDLKHTWDKAKESASHGLEKAKADVKYGWEKTKSKVKSIVRPKNRQAGEQRTTTSYCSVPNHYHHYHHHHHHICG